jgi:hypothetical protein
MVFLCILLVLWYFWQVLSFNKHIKVRKQHKLVAFVKKRIAQTAKCRRHLQVKLAVD